MRQAGLYGLLDHLHRLSAVGDPLEALIRSIDFEAFRPSLIAVLVYADGAKGGRPPYDPVMMFKVLILAAQNNVSDARLKYLIRDRLSWLRFLGLDLGAPTPDANTIRLFRERLTEAGALDVPFADFDRQLKERGYFAMGGEIVDATLVAAPKLRNTEPEKAAIKEGNTAAEIWPDAPARAAQEDTDARCSPRAARPQMENRRSTSRSPVLATRAASRFAGSLAPSARARPPMARALMAGCCAMWGRPTTSRRTSGPIQPIAARPTRRG